LSGACGGSGACGTPVNAGAEELPCGAAVLSPGNGNLSVVDLPSAGFDPQGCGWGMTLHGAGEVWDVGWVVACAPAMPAGRDRASTSNIRFASRQAIVTSLDAEESPGSRLRRPDRRCNNLS